MQKVLLAIMAVIFVATIWILFAQIREQSYEVELRNGLLLTCFYPQLQNAVDCYYGPQKGVHVNNYMGEVLSISHVQYGYYITLCIYPYVGPHNTVGIDEVTFFVNNSGIVKQESFEHVKDYEYP